MVGRIQASHYSSPNLTMQLSGFDWAIIGFFFLVYLVIGVLVSRQAGKSFRSFFLGSQKMPWWLLGLSMVATTFATDTPNLVANIVRQNGVSGNWVWWAFLLSGVVTVFFFAKLWRRSGVMTDIEFNELRYSGKEAAVLRGFRAVYLGVIFNTIIMANVTLAAIKIGAVMFGLSPMQTILIASVITVVYASAGGLTGVLLTDCIQFALAVGGAIGAAIFVTNMPEVGGWSSLIANEHVVDKLSIFPDFNNTPWEVVTAIFVIPLAVQWWATYYPGAEPGGGGYVVQRVLAAKNERHAAGATLLFNLLHYAVRPWPWIIVALASLVVFPDLNALQEQFPNIDSSLVKDDLAYPAMLTYLPSGLLGLVVTSLIAAYMSTMSTQINWGSSIVVNDLYHRFMAPDATEKQLVRVGRIVTVISMLLACAVALFLESALGAFEILLQIGAGTGLIFLLRWFWWRINATAEITAMMVSFGVALFFHFVDPDGWSTAGRLLGGIAITTIAWLAAAFVSRPTEEAKLREFYRKIQPGGPGWKHVIEGAERAGDKIVDPGQKGDLPSAFLCSLGALVAIYGILFTTGYVLYGRVVPAIVTGVLAVAGALLLKANWKKLSFD